MLSSLAGSKLTRWWGGQLITARLPLFSFLGIVDKEEVAGGINFIADTHGFKILVFKSWWKYGS
jgi:hypothetical protein